MAASMVQLINSYFELSSQMFPGLNPIATKLRATAYVDPR